MSRYFHHSRTLHDCSIQVFSSASYMVMYTLTATRTMTCHPCMLMEANNSLATGYSLFRKDKLVLHSSSASHSASVTAIETKEANPTRKDVLETVSLALSLYNMTDLPISIF